MPDGLDAIEPGPGLNLVIGANGSGKSSLTAGVLQSLFNEVHDDQLVMTLSLADGLGLSHAHGRSTWKGGAPALPPPHLASSYRLGLLDLGEEGDSEADLVQRLKRELAGGYDLDGLAEGRRVKQGHGRKIWQAHRQAEQVLQKALNSYDSLQRKQKGLAGLKDELRQAEQGQARLQALSFARQHLERRHTIASDEAILSAAPAGWQDTPADALDQVRKATKQLHDLDERHQVLLERIRDTDVSLQTLALTEPLADHELRAWRHRAKRLEGLEREQGERQRQRASLRPRVDVVDQGQLLPNVDALEKMIIERAQLQQQIQSLELKLVAMEPAVAELPEAIHLGRDLLTQWLQAVRPRQLPIWLLFILALLLLMGLVVGIQGHWLGYGVAALACFLLVWTQQEPEDSRPRLQRRYEDTGLPRPESWDVSSVGETMGQLNDQVEADDDARAKALLRSENEERLEAAGRRLEEINGELTEIARSLGLSDESTGLGLREAVEALKDRRALHKLENESEAVQADVDTLRRQAMDAFGSLGLMSPVDGPGLDAFIEDLRERSQELQQLRDQQVDLEKQSAQLQSDRDQVIETRDALLGDGDLAALEDRVAEGVAAREAEIRLQRDRAELARLAAQIEDPELLDCDEETLSLLTADCNEALASMKTLSAEIAAIEADIRRAQQDAPLREADQGFEAANEALEKSYEDGLECLADDFLAKALRADYQSQSSPRLFGRVKERLDAFTMGRYELELHAGSLRAVDHRGLGSQPLSALSHGTRVQLLLAARLAYIEAHEEGSCLPLFLDEALSITDPERFEAVAKVLMELVTQGRQIFYLSCDGTDVQRWVRTAKTLGHPAPTVIHLGRVAALNPFDEPPEVIGPQPGESAEDYGRRLGVSDFGLWSNLDSLDLFYLLEDRLDLVHRLRQVHQRRLGPYAALRSRARNPAQLAAEENLLIEQRAALFRDFLRLQRIGRGAPIQPSVFDDDRLRPSSKALLEELLRQIGGDVDKLMTRVQAREGEIFRRKQRDLAEVVAQILEENGALDPRSILASSERLGRLADLHGDRLELATITWLDRLWSQRLFAQAVVEANAQESD